jgi:dienelactone hydrolase
MRIAGVVLAAACAAGLAAQQLYEEDPLASMPVREKLWKQMEVYAGSLSSGPNQALAAVEPLRALLRARIGYPPPGLISSGKMRMERIGEDTGATYYRLWIPVAPQMDAYGLYIVPRNAPKPAPLVISQHGGGGFPELATFQGGGNYKDMVRGAVAQGWIVYAPHHLFYPYRDRDHGSPIPEKVRERLDDKLRAAGTSLAAVEVAKISRALDVLLARPEVDRKRVAMVGLSYGGFYTMYTAALEPRIGAAVASCSFREQPGAGSDYSGGKLNDLAPGEVAALVFPRPLQVQAGISDKLMSIDSIRKEAARAAEYYRKLGSAGRFSFETFKGGHEFRSDIAWAFLRKYFNGKE